MFKPRPKQQEVLEYKQGKMGVAAVPGSGKTATLSYLAAQLVAQTDLEDGQEILIVTLVNSAVSNFARQVNEYINSDGLLPGFGYRVRTLHGLANDIVRQKPSLAQVAENFIILDERESNEILEDAVEAWTRNHPLAPDDYLANEYRDNNYYKTHHWSRIVTDMARNFIRQAKDYVLSPDDVQKLLRDYDGDLLLAQMCADIYRDYESGLNYRGAVDFQDLIRLALQVLQRDELYLKSLQHKWVYILEDEAQDSSKLQEDILRMLAGEGGNWVRVGDPNQAIFETFTTANPKYLRHFINNDDVMGRELPNSGRSTRSIQKLANYLIKWSLKHPHQAIRERLPLTEPFIQPTPKGDPQPNPPNDKRGVILHPESFNPTQEALRVMDSIANWLPDHQDETVAILVPRNARGSEIVQLLKKKDIPYVENLNSTSSTRAVVGSLTRILNYLADPKDAGKLAGVYQVWMRDYRDDPEASAGIESVMKELKKIRHVEDYVVPRLSDWLDDNVSSEDNTALHNQLVEFRNIIGQWLRAAELPIDQLILTVAGDIFIDAGDIATAYMVALLMQRDSQTHPDMRLPEFADELKNIAMNKRKFSGLGDDESRFDPDAHKGKVTVTTMHKAKGLEWDRVYLLSMNNYDFPSGDPHDSYIGEKWFIRDNLNLAEECLAQLNLLRNHETYNEGDATLSSRIEYAAERLRLLYVGITRARKELIITWNTGRGEATEATPLVALRTFWEKERKK